MSEAEIVRPSRLHPLWLLFSFVKMVKGMVFPAIFLFVLKSGSQSEFIKYGKMAFFIYLAYWVVSTLITWWRLTYVVKDNELVMQEGRFSMSKRHVPYERIENVQVQTNFLHRLFGLTSLKLEIGSSTDEATVQFEVISKKEAERIQKKINASKMDKKPLQNETEEAVERKVHYKVSLKEIIFASFTSFRFLIIVPIIFSIYSKVDELYSLEEQTVNFYESISTSWLFITIVCIIAFILSIFLGFIVTYLRYGKFEVSSDESHIFIKKGIFNETEFSIQKKKVQAVKIHKSFLRRIFRLAEVKLISAGSVEGEEADTNSLFPFLKEKQAYRLIEEILPHYQVDTKMTKLPKSALFVKLIRPSYFWIIATALLFYFKREFLYFSLILLALIIILRIFDYMNSRYTINDLFMQLQTGSISVDLFLTPRKKIDEFEIIQSSLQRKFNLATIQVTNRAKPIYVTTLKDVPKEIAGYSYKWYKSSYFKEVRNDSKII